MLWEHNSTSYKKYAKRSFLSKAFSYISTFDITVLKHQKVTGQVV